MHKHTISVILIAAIEQENSRTEATVTTTTKYQAAHTLQCIMQDIDAICSIKCLLCVYR